jgi:hypothetical protein
VGVNGSAAVIRSSSCSCLHLEIHLESSTCDVIVKPRMGRHALSFVQNQSSIVQDLRHMIAFLSDEMGVFALE